jgi:hypothetical protein
MSLFETVLGVLDKVSQVPDPLFASTANHVSVADPSDGGASQDDAPTSDMLAIPEKSPDPCSPRSSGLSSSTDVEHTAGYSCPLPASWTDQVGDHITSDGSSLDRQDRGEQAGKVPQLISVFEANQRKFGREAQPDLPNWGNTDPKIHNFNRPMSKSDIAQRVIPWKATVRKGDLQQRLQRNTMVPARNMGSTYNMTKVEARAELAWLIASGSKIDWAEVRNLRKIIAG